MKWLKNLFVSSAPKSVLKLNIKKVSFTFGLLGCGYHESVFDKVLMFANEKQLVPIKQAANGVSIASIVLAEKADLNIELHFNSFLQQDGCEVIYLEEDSKSKELALLFAGEFEARFKIKSYVKGVNRTDRGSASINQYKHIKYKILVKPFNYNMLGEGVDYKAYAEFINNWVGKL